MYTRILHDCYYLSEVSGELKEDLGWHGSVKPMSVVVDIVQRVSATGTIVFDGFLGSGTTLIACERLGRKCRAANKSSLRRRGAREVLPNE